MKQNKQKIKLLCLAVLAMAMALVVAGCTGSGDKTATEEPPKTITVKHGEGETEVPLNPKRVVVLNFGALDTMDKLGLEDSVVGIAGNLVPAYLTKYKDAKYTDLGDLRELNYEKISSLNPDLIITSARHTEQYGELSKIAPTINMGVDFANYWPSFQERTKTIGRIFEKEKEADAALAALQTKVDALKEMTSKKEEKGTVIITNGGKLSVFGPASRYAFVYDLTGAKPMDAAAQAAGTHGSKASFEIFQQENPAWLIVVDRDSAIGAGNAAKALLDTPLMNNTDAAKNGKIVYVDPALWYLSGGGLESMELQLKDIEQALK